MAIQLQKILTSEEFQIINNRAMYNGLSNQDLSVFTPGMGWEQNWYYDPSGQREKYHKHVMYSAQDREDILSEKTESHFLSMHYWRDWSHIRPPICVVLPNFTTWEIDRTSKNNNTPDSGWKVTGFFPYITCSPSIDVIGYHGHLVRGVFSKDLEGRGQDGVRTY